MTKRLNNKSVYMVVTKEGVYNVILERLKNGYCGNPRFKAHIIKNFQAYVYTFDGHYYEEQEEANFIVRRHLETINK